AAFEPVPQAEAAQPVAKAEKPAASGVYTVEVEGKAFVVKVSEGQTVAAGEVLLILEAMKMETEIRAAQAGTVRGIAVKAGDA
ncbi:oxaloacetate decarboxylase, partial [Klebsiella pneumoniae]